MAKGTLRLSVGKDWHEGLCIVNESGTMIDVALLDGNIYQISVSGEGMVLTLHPVSLISNDRCSIIEGRRQCGLNMGHGGGHMYVMAERRQR